MYASTSVAAGFLGALDLAWAPWHCPSHGSCIDRVTAFATGRNRLSPTLKQNPKRVEKSWGHELIWAESDQYVGKILHIRAGEALSLQYHEMKDETIHLLTGEMFFEAGSSPDELERIDLRTGESFRVRPGTVHRMTAVTDCDVLEASTPHLSDVVRITDRYGRAPEGE